MDGLILAIDLGKFNSVCCWYDFATKSTTFRHAKTTLAELFPFSPPGFAGEGPGVRVFAFARLPRDELPRCRRRSTCSPSLRRRTDGPGESVPFRGAAVD